nr:hypothetical protein [Corynebacterium lactis]
MTSGTLLLLGITAWFYPLCALSDGPSSLPATLAEASALAVKHLPRTALAVLALLIAPLAVYFFPTHLMAIGTYWVLIGNALSWYLVTLALQPVIEPAEPKRLEPR